MGGVHERRGVKKEGGVTDRELGAPQMHDVATLAPYFP